MLKPQVQQKDIHKEIKAEQQVHIECLFSTICMMTGIYSYNTTNIIPADLNISVSLLWKPGKKKVSVKILIYLLTI